MKHSGIPLSKLPLKLQAQVLGQQPQAKPEKRLRQKEVKMNGLELRFYEHLKKQYAGALDRIYPQGVTLLLGNGVRYTPDFTHINSLGRFQFFETKGSFMRDDAAVKLKVAASTFPLCQFTLVWWKDGAWNFQYILS